jgi:tape measure domain-containing protein
MMPSEDLTIRLGLKGQQQVSRGLRQVKGDEQAVGAAAETAGAKAQMMGAKFTKASDKATVSLGKLVGAIGIVQGAQGLGRLAAAGVKWGLSFNAQVESARLRFGLFTDDVQGLTKAVQQIDMKSAFNFGDLSDAAALLGNSGVRDIPGVLQAAANAAAASGRGTQALNSITIALSQIASKGRVSQEEINQLNEAGAPGAQRIIAQHFHLTAKELMNLGNQGLDAKEAIKAHTAEWTSGKMAKAAEQQTHTLGGQWMLLTGNMQKAAGAATLGLAHGLEKNVLPAANKAAAEITKIFGNEGLSNEEKLRRARAVIKRELGPVANDIKGEIDKADIPGHLGDLVGAALPKMADAAAQAAPHVAGAFVTAWLHSGPWVQLATLLFAAKKLGDARGGLGGGKGGIGGLLNKPVPVYVTNWGGTPGKGTLGKIGNAVKRVGPLAVGAAGAAADVAGAAGAGASFAAPAAVPLAGITALAITQGHFNNVTRGPGSNAAGYLGAAPAPGFGGAMPGMLPSPAAASEIGRQIAAGARFTFTLDGSPVAATVRRANAKKKARG